MRERHQRRWSFWVGKGAVAMAILAALALAATVWLAQRALADAAETVIRGDGESLIRSVVVDLWQTESALSREALAAMIAKHAANGLRYVALRDRQDHHLIAQAGASVIADARYRTGEVLRKRGRVRLVALIPPRSETRAGIGPTSSPTGPAQLLPFPRPYLVIEFEPPLLARLQQELKRISLVAVVAELVLIAFAVALSHTTARLWAARQQAESERRLVELGRASAVIAHELRNPLAVLKGHAQLLAEDLTEPARAKAARVVEGAERLEDLTTVLLDFVRDAPIDVRSVTPAELVDRALAALPKDHVRVDLSYAPETLECDAERISLALRNLVDNAVQATPQGADPVELRIAKNSHNAVIEVRDHGPGLAASADAQIFEPFVTSKARGTGLGLSIARRIAEQHHGTLRAETHSQGGAVFRLVLPLVSSPAQPA
jgi:two-component system sensor histidine kinase HydH